MIPQVVMLLLTPPPLVPACLPTMIPQVVMLGLGETQHAQRPAAHEPGRKGISVERTFAAISSRQDLEATVSIVRPRLAARFGGGEGSGLCDEPPCHY
jgi:hypothetical protein